MNTRITYPFAPILRAMILFLLSGAIGMAPILPAHAQTAALPADRVSVVIELDAPSAAQIYASTLAELATTAQAAAGDDALAAQLSAATQRQTAANQAAQEALLAPLADLGAQVIYRVQRVYNGIAVRIAPEQIQQVYALAGVAGVHPLIAKQPTNAASVPFIGAPALWQGLGNGVSATGAGVRMAVIDTGVDYLHTAFGGPGTGYKDNDVTKIGDIPYFPSYKIVGGYDFSGDDYNADPEDSDYQPIGKPDPDPMDCYSHGTHVAATAAGFGVTLDGKTYPGPYNQILNAGQFIIGPGVAPQAEIYALKVFGCTGSSEIVDLGIEWAVDPNGDGDFRDRVDVINMSLGSTYGGVYDATSIAADRAAQVGIIVVASAGNSGDSYYAVGSPGTTQRAISVAATRLAGAVSPPDASLVDTIAGFSSRGPRRIGSLVKPDLAAPGYQITSARAGTGNGSSTLNGTSMAAPHVAGAMALLLQNHPTWSPEELKALVMNTAMPAVRGDTPYSAAFLGPGRVGAGRIDLPAAASAETIVYNADEAGTVGVSFGASEVVDVASATRNVRVLNKGNDAVNYTLTYSPRTDIPGVAFSLPANNAISLPAGGVATFSVGMTATASQMQHTRDPAVPDVQGFPRHWLSEESGVLMLWPNPTVLNAHLTGAGMTPPTGSQASSDVSFSYDPNTKQLSYTLSVAGLAPEAITGAALLAGLPGLPSSAIAYPLYQGGGTLAPGAPVQGIVTLSAHDETLLAAGYLHATLFTAEFPQGELRGQATMAKPALKLPIYAAPRPASVMAAVNLPLDFGATAQTTRDLTLAGQGLSGATYPLDYLSLVSALELHVRSPNVPPLSVLRPEPDIYDHADIKFVGIANDLRATGLVNQTMLSFGLVTHADWASPREVELSVYMDIDEDGVFDYRLFNSDQNGFNNRFRTSDAFITALENLHTGQRTSQEFLNGLSAQNYDTAIFNSNVMLLPVRAALLGLTASNTDFDYYVETKSSETIGVVDRTPTRKYNLAQVGLDTTGGRRGAPIYDDVDGATIPVTFDLAKLEDSDVDALLLLHHHNAAGQRAQMVPVSFSPPGLIYLPLIRR